MNYYRRYMGDYARDTAHLSLAEHGAYTLLLDHCYSHDTADLPPLVQVYRICRAITPEEREAVDSVIAQYWPSKRLAEDIPKAIREIQRMRELGSRGGKAKAAKRENDSAPTSAEDSAEPSVKSSVRSRSSNHQPPTTRSNHQPPDPTTSLPSVNSQEELRSGNPSNVSAAQTKTRRPRASKSSKSNGASVETWQAYWGAYRERYGVEPVQNAKVNGQLSQLVGRLGAADAPRVAAWYPGHQGQLYVRSGHCVDLLLRDAEKLRTEWATGHRIRAGSEETNIDRARRIIQERNHERQGAGRTIDSGGGNGSEIE